MSGCLCDPPDLTHLKWIFRHRVKMDCLKTMSIISWYLVQFALYNLLRNYSIPFSLSLIFLNVFVQRLSSSFGVFSKPSFCKSFSASFTNTVCSMDWNSPSVYISHSSFAACSLDRRNVKIMEPLEVLTNAAPLGRCYKRKLCMLLSSSS